jgi:hypothetical protein
MKTCGLFFFMMLVASYLFSQETSIAAVSENGCDSLYWTSTEYPVRLNIKATEIQKQLSDQLTLYPEDLKKVVEFTYRYKINCAGQKIESSLVASQGVQSLGLSKRIKGILDEICSWKPAIHREKPVNSFYDLTVGLRDGRIEVRPQNKSEM